MNPLAIVPALVLPILSGAAAPQNLLVNGDFEQGLTGWGKLWTRSGSGEATLDDQVRRFGRQAVRIRHTGEQDWSFSQEKPIEVAPGQIYELSGWVRLSGQGDCSLSVILRDAKGDVIDWSFGAATTQQSEPWRQLRSRFIIPPGAATILPRLIGNRPATVWLDDVVLVQAGTLEALRAANLPESIQLAQKDLDVTLRTSDGTLTIADRRSRRTWQQRPGSRLIVLDAKPAGQTVRLRLLDPATAWELGAAVTLDDRRPEVTVELSGSGEMEKPLGYPPPFVTAKGEVLIMPVNEGISYPVDDPSLPAMHYILYGGHGLCMAWYGVTDGREGLMTLVETPDDASVQVARLDGRLCLAPQWQAQRGQFGPARRLRYVLFDQGGYVAMCKRYR